MHGEVVGGALFVSRGNAAELFEAIEQSLDAVARPIGLRIEARAAALLRGCGDHRADAAPAQVSADGPARERLATPQIRDMFPDQKQSTLAGTLSNLRRDSLLQSESGMWFPVERTEAADEGLAEEGETAPVADAMASNEVDQDLLKAAP